MKKMWDKIYYLVSNSLYGTAHILISMIVTFAVTGISYLFTDNANIYYSFGMAASLYMAGLYYGREEANVEEKHYVEGIKRYYPIWWQADELGDWGLPQLWNFLCMYLWYIYVYPNIVL